MRKSRKETEDFHFEITNWEMKIKLKTVGISEDETAVRIDDTEVDLDKLYEALKKMDISDNARRGLLFGLAGVLDMWKLNILAMVDEFEEEKR